MRLYYFVIFSVLLHFFIYLLSQEIASQFETVEPLTEVEIEILQEKLKEARIVKDFEMPEPESLDSSDTNIFSARNLKFKKEQRAALEGPTENRSPKKREETQAELVKKIEAINKLSAEVIQQIKKDNIKRAKQAQKKQESQRANPFQAKQGVSTFYDPNTNLEVGNFTVLNTNRYLFYTFFRRLEEQIVPHYTSQVRRISQSNPRLRRRDRDKTAWTTEFEVLLDAKGEFVRGDIYRSSGLQGFDLAVLEAFKKGAPFQNPPQEMVEEDGYIHIRAFITYFWDPNQIRATN